MEKSNQARLLFQILRRFSESGVLSQCMLIGSWCLYFYSDSFGKSELLSILRTTDVDFLIPRPGLIKKPVDIPEILKQEGFIPIMNYSNGLVRYQHADLLVEFLVPELGRGFDEPRNIRPWHIQAQEIRYLNFLTAYPKKIYYQNMTICVPEPAAFALHKLIVSSKRSKPDKKQKDLAAATGILELLFKDPDEKKRVIGIMSKIPPKWRKIILSASAKHFPALNQLYEK